MDGDNKLSEVSTGQTLSAESDLKVYEAIRAALANARASVVVAVNSAMVGIYWDTGIRKMVYCCEFA